MIETNFKIKAKQLHQYAKDLSRKHLRNAMWAILEEVANTSVAEFMVSLQRQGQEDFRAAIAAQPTGRRLRTRTGRLAASVVGAWRFNRSGLPVDVKRAMRPKEKVSGEGIQESIRKVKVGMGKVDGLIGTKVEYAEIHEKGGTTHPRITPKSRRFFWAMFAESGDDKWKAMALTSKERFSINIPARPYLKPAVRKAIPGIKEIFKRTIISTFKEAKI